MKSAAEPLNDKETIAGWFGKVFSYKERAETTLSRGRSSCVLGRNLRELISTHPSYLSIQMKDDKDKSELLHL